MNARAIVAVTIAAAASIIVSIARSSTPPALRAPIEMFGVVPKDSVSIDGTPANVKGGAAAQVFSGLPFAANAPVVVETNAGEHAIVITRDACPARTLAVKTQGVYKHTIVLAPLDPSTCAMPMPPARRE